MRRRGPSWGRSFSPLGCWTQVDPRQTQAVLRRMFQRWGRPESLRADNGAPWGSHGDLPTDLVCWLAGLGVTVTANPPRRPQANGVVERSQGVGKQWSERVRPMIDVSLESGCETSLLGEPSTRLTFGRVSVNSDIWEAFGNINHRSHPSEPMACQDAAELQRRLDVVDRWQRERYPAVKGRSRMEAHPGLAHSGRGYEMASEPESWQLPKVRELMGTHRVPRRVDRQGKLSIYNRPYSVGVVWAGRTVWVGFDALTGDRTFQEERGVEIRRQAAEELRAEAVTAMEVTCRRRGAHAAKPPGQIPEAQPTGP